MTEKSKDKVYEDSISNWPEEERPRERLLKFGPNALTNAELLAILLRVGVKGKSAVDLARHIIRETKGLRGLDKLEPKDLFNIKGLNLAKIAQIKASIELGKRIFEEPKKLEGIASSSRKAYDMLFPRMRDLKKEVFKVIFLNSHNQVIDIVTAHEGTVTMSNVYVREIINLANKFGAASMIFAHNHPSGEPKPSNEDKEITEELVFAGRIMKIKVLDHIIIGEEKYFSFADEGLIKRYNTNFDKRK
ncbi:MAG: DNA repair protein RadC [Candidatus Scalindua rubra]|uniref:DNA repair protein RadC n=1 Tax=Candidatus Scalindua rubra TaxID=1872076 RepID=A0A1E3X7S3_9BACT|nr:MAG: DNA repair protein RadC [Candidatus Scalindua rubra]